MNSKVLYFSLIAVVAISVGAFTEAKTETNPIIVNTISSSMIDVPIEIMVNTAEYVIVGKVISVEPVVYIDPKLQSDKLANTNEDIIILEKEILSDVTIGVEEDLFGLYDEEMITVRVPGGEINGYRTVHESSSEFTEGERVILFVGHGQSYNISGDHYTVIGYDQGTIRLDESNTFIASLGFEAESSIDSKYADDNTSEEEIKRLIQAKRN